MATDFTIADVLAWARTKPADGRYNFNDTDNCALCQFLRETGIPFDGGVGGTFWQRPDGSNVDLPVELANALLHGGTFGGLAKILQEFCPETPVTPSNWLTIDAYLTEQEAA